VETKHTPGKWEMTTDGEANFFGICTSQFPDRNENEPKHNWLFRIQQNGELSIPEQEANAKLIESAPDLLKALSELIIACLQTADTTLMFDELLNAQKAINKAIQ
jgi:hypothetical protein